MFQGLDRNFKINIYFFWLVCLELSCKEYMRIPHLFLRCCYFLYPIGTWPAAVSFAFWFFSKLLRLNIFLERNNSRINLKIISSFTLYGKIIIKLKIGNNVNLKNRRWVSIREQYGTLVENYEFVQFNLSTFFSWVRKLNIGL